MDNVDFKLPWKLPKQKTLIETNINTKNKNKKLECMKYTVPCSVYREKCYSQYSLNVCCRQ